MKTKLHYLFIALALFCVLNSPFTNVFAQGTAFTYQGRLSDGANPANGFYDLRFSLFTVPTGGSLAYGYLTNSATPVTNGLFTVTLDFGAGVFNSTPYWLQIGVRTNGIGGFNGLSPRQELTPTPYSIYAENANAAGLSGSIPSTDLSGVDGTGLTGVALLAGGNNFTGNQTVGGTVQINGAEQITGASGAGFHADENIGPNLYYSGEEHGLNFDYGTVKGQNIGSMIMGYNGQGYFSVGNFYQIGSGTKAFTVFGDGNVNVDPMGMNSGIINNGDTNSSALTFGIGSGEGIGSQRLPGVGDNQYGLDFYTDFHHRMTISQGGLVGINVGTNPPTAQLEVNGAVRTDGGELYLEASTAGNYANDGLVYGDGSLAGINYGNSGPWLAGFYGGALGALAPNTVALSWDSGGDCWVSNNISAGTVTVRNNASGASEYFYETGSSILASGEYLGVYGLGGVQPYIGDDGSGNDVQIGSLTHGVTAVACYNATDGAYMHLYCSSITIEGGADLAEPFKITQAAQPVEEGEVVVIDDANPGQLKLTDRPYDPRVAGVVSGANGIHPGIQMHQEGLLEGGKNVALTGRVYVKAEVSNGPIKPGDLLTTSSTPGRAMRVSDHLRAQGAILGKAMTALNEGEGMVLVLVTLQ